MPDNAEHGRQRPGPAYDPAGPRAPADLPPARSSAGMVHGAGELHRLLVDSVRDYAIFALDPAGHVLTWNQGAQRLKGWSPDEIIGRHFSTFYPPDAIAANQPARELREASQRGAVEDEGGASGRTALHSGPTSSSRPCGTTAADWWDSRKSRAT